MTRLLDNCFYNKYDIARIVTVLRYYNITVRGREKVLIFDFVFALCTI